MDNVFVVARPAKTLYTLSVDRDRAEERQQAKEAILAVLSGLLTEDRPIVIDDVRYLLAHPPDALKHAPTSPAAANGKAKAKKKAQPRLARAIKKAKAASTSVEALETPKSQRSREALLALARRSPASFSWLCVQVYGENTKSNRQALSTLLMNMNKKKLIQRTADGFVATAMGQHLATSLVKRGAEQRALPLEDSQDAEEAN